MTCPFMKEEGHDDTPDSDDKIDFTKTPPIPVDATGVPGTGRLPRVGVREPARPFPQYLQAAAARPLPELQERGGEAVTEQSKATVRQIMEVAEEAVGRPAANAVIGEADVAYLGKIGVFSGSLELSVGEQNVRAGQARMDAIQRQMAEEAVAEALVPAEAVQIDVLRELVQRPPAGLVAIPLLAEAFRLLRRSALFRSGVPIQPGRLGTVGRMDPPREASTFRSSNVPKIQSAKGAFTGRGVAPAPASIGATLFNAADRMRRLVEVSRRSVAQNISGPSDRGL